MADSVISRQVKLRRGFYVRNGVTTINGRAVFIDEHKVEVTSPGGATETVEADGFVISTGSRPYRPDGIDFSHPRIVDSDTVLNLGSTPQSITIYGAGVVGCEYASIFQGLGTQVNLVNTQDKLLSFLDDEIIDALSFCMREQGVLIRHNEEFEKISPDLSGVGTKLKSNK